MQVINIKPNSELAANIRLAIMKCRKGIAHEFMNNQESYFIKKENSNFLIKKNC